MPAITAKGRTQPTRKPFSALGGGCTLYVTPAESCSSVSVWSPLLTENSIELFRRILVRRGSRVLHCARDMRVAAGKGHDLAVLEL